MLNWDKNICTNTFCVQLVGMFVNQVHHLHLEPNAFYNLDKSVLQFVQYTFVFTQLGGV